MAKFNHLLQFYELITNNTIIIIILIIIHIMSAIIIIISIIIYVEVNEDFAIILGFFLLKHT